MIIGIDASNLLQGGGRTHLLEFLSAADPHEHGVDQVVVWGRKATLDILPKRPWLKQQAHPLLEKGVLARALWQRFLLAASARRSNCDLLFVPGGTVSGSFRPVVTMSRNMLPFEWPELRRYMPSRTFIRLLLLRISMAASFRRSDGVIFLTGYARREVQEVTGRLPGLVSTIPHGVSERFFISPREQRPITACTRSSPLRIVYVSIVDEYKHQCSVVEAVARLRAEAGWPVVLDLVGPAYRPALQRLRGCLDRHDPAREWVQYHGDVPYDKVHAFYDRSDVAVFASSCENMPNILLEMMAAGLPVASSDRGPMREILGSAGSYFDPEDPRTLADALRRMIASPEMRGELSKASYQIARTYSWRHCADQTLQFLAQTAIAFRSSQGQQCAV